MISAIRSFTTNYRFLSNFWPANIRYGSWTYPYVENAFQALKAESVTEHARFVTMTPSQAKREGHTLLLRDGWDELRIPYMKLLVRRKFQIPELNKLLRDTTGLYLEEGNYWHDNFWGNCSCSGCKEIQGENQLGKILMEVRSELL